MRCSPIDLNEVVRIMTHESVYDMIADDSVVNKKQTSKHISGLLNCLAVYVLKPSDDIIVLFTPINHVTYDVHIATVAGPGRVVAVQSVLSAARWMVKNTPCKKIVSMIPSDLYPQTAAFALKCGMKHEGLLKKSYCKNDQLYDLEVFGITDKEIPWQQ